MPYKDPRKEKEYQKAYNREWKKKRKAAGKKHVEKIKARGCDECGQRLPPSAMDFHHIDPNTKTNKKIGNAICYDWPIPKIDAEIAKCKLVCANCHRIIHASVEEVLEFNIRQTTETQRDSSGVRRI